jgi:hypothetical protein
LEVEKLNNYRLPINPANEHVFYDLTRLDGKLFKIEKYAFTGYIQKNLS